MGLRWIRLRLDWDWEWREVEAEMGWGDWGWVEYLPICFFRWFLLWCAHHGWVDIRKQAGLGIEAKKTNRRHLESKSMGWMNGILPFLPAYLHEGSTVQYDSPRDQAPWYDIPQNAFYAAKFASQNIYIPSSPLLFSMTWVPQFLSYEDHAFAPIDLIWKVAPGSSVLSPCTVQLIPMLASAPLIIPHGNQRNCYWF